MIRARAIIVAVLTLLVTLTGIGAAMARGGMAADGVICGTGDFVVVLAADGLPLFDASGNPVEAQDLPCLDCTFGAAILTVAPDASPFTTEGRAFAPLAHPPSAARLWRMGGMGRSPPLAA
jgi:hypothetical protein